MDKKFGLILAGSLWVDIQDQERLLHRRSRGFKG